MIDLAVIITAAVASVVTLVTNLFQIYYDYKKSESKGNSHWEPIISSCCTTVNTATSED